MADNAITPDDRPAENLTGEKQSHNIDYERRGSVPNIDINKNIDAK